MRKTLLLYRLIAVQEAVFRLLHWVVEAESAQEFFVGGIYFFLGQLQNGFFFRAAQCHLGLAAPRWIESSCHYSV